MGTSAFDKVWGTPPTTAAFDAAWDGPSTHSIHEEYKSGRLQRRMARENANDQEQAAADDPSLSTLIPGAIANASHGIPGAELVQAGARSLVRGQPYRQALEDLRGTTAQIPSSLSTAQHIIGALPLAGVMPGSPAVAGAVLGGMDGALGADPDQSLGDRAMKGAFGAAVGGTVGKLGEMGLTGARALLATGPAKNILARQVARAASAQRLYGAAMKEGQGRLGTAAVQKFLGEPDIAEIVGELQQTRPFANTAADSPEMLDAVYKTLSDRAATLKKGMESISPNRPNIGRFRMADTRAAQNDLLDAVSGGQSMPGPMPTMRTAVQDYAEKSGGIEGVQKGYDALRTGIANRMPRAANLTRTTPEALSVWAAKANPTEIQGASEGILGATKTAMGNAFFKDGRRAVSQAPSLLRAIGAPQQNLLDMLARLGLTSANASTRP